MLLRRMKTALEKKDAIAFPNVFAKVDEVYSRERGPSVVTKDLSLKTLILVFVTVIDSVLRRSLILSAEL